MSKRYVPTRVSWTYSLIKNTIDECYKAYSNGADIPTTSRHCDKCLAQKYKIKGATDCHFEQGWRRAKVPYVRDMTLKDKKKWLKHTTEDLLDPLYLDLAKVKEQGNE